MTSRLLALSNSHVMTSITTMFYISDHCNFKSVPMFSKVYYIIKQKAIALCFTLVMANKGFPI